MHTLSNPKAKPVRSCKANLKATPNFPQSLVRSSDGANCDFNCSHDITREWVFPTWAQGVWREDVDMPHTQLGRHCCIPNVIIEPQSSLVTGAHFASFHLLLVMKCSPITDWRYGNWVCQHQGFHCQRTPPSYLPTHVACANQPTEHDVLSDHHGDEDWFTPPIIMMRSQQERRHCPSRHFAPNLTQPPILQLRVCWTESCSLQSLSRRLEGGGECPEGVAVFQH